MKIFIAIYPWYSIISYKNNFFVQIFLQSNHNQVAQINISSKLKTFIINLFMAMFTEYLIK